MRINSRISTVPTYNRVHSRLANAVSFFPSAAPGKPSVNLPFIQPKLTINQPNDVYEQEADSIANRVVQMPANGNSFFKPVSNLLQLHNDSLATGKLQRLVKKTEIKNCTDFSDKAFEDLVAGEQKAFDLLRKGIDKIQIAEDEYTQAMHKYSGPTLKQLQEFQQAFMVGNAFQSAFGVSASSTESWDKLRIVKIRFMEVLRWLDQVVFQYVCVGSGEMCPANRFAFVDTNKDHRTIHLCPKFWESGLTDRGHTIAHEILHLWGGGFMKDTIEKVFDIEKVTPRFQDVNRYESFLRLLNK